MVQIGEADDNDIKSLSRTLLSFLEDKNGEVYQENIAKFGIPEEYVRRAFSEENLLKAKSTEKANFYLAVEEGKIMGFAQTVIRSTDTIELDRIIIFPEHTRKGIGTQLLRYVLTKSKQSGFKRVIVNAGREELHARKFYEKNGFEKLKEYTIDTPWGNKLSLVTYQLSL